MWLFAPFLHEFGKPTAKYLYPIDSMIDILMLLKYPIFPLDSVGWRDSASFSVGSFGSVPKITLCFQTLMGSLG